MSPLWKVILIKYEFFKVQQHYLSITQNFRLKYLWKAFDKYLKGKSSLIIYERHANLKYKHGNRSFWCRGYYVDTTGKNAKRIAEYIQNQLKEDQINDQITIKEYIDPFKGGK